MTKTIDLKFRFHDKQVIAINSTATELLFGGAAGGGKSHLMRAAAIAWALSIPGLQIYFFRRTFPDLLANHMEGPSGFPAMVAPLLDAGVAAINYSRGEIRFAGGSKIHLCHCQHEKDVYKYQGAEIHVLIIDEITQWFAGMYRFLRSRVRMAGITLPDRYSGQFPRVVCSGNPGGIGHNWVKNMWVDFAPELKIKTAPKSDGGMTRQYIPSRLEDNPTLTENDPDYEQRLEGLGNAALVRAMRMGDWNIVAGGMFDDLWSPGRHIVEPFEIPDGWYIDRSFDWGSSAPFSVGWWAESNGEELPGGRSWPAGTLFRIAEWYGCARDSQGNIQPNTGIKMLSEEIAQGIIEREAEWGLSGRVQDGVADSAIWAQEDGPSIAENMSEAGVDWYPANKKPGSRKQGAEEFRRRLKASLKSPMEQPGLFVFDSCRDFIRTIPTLPRSERDPDDIDTKAEDHCYDESRYRLQAAGQIAVA